MRTVYKYPIRMEWDFELVLPVGARILHADEQNLQPVLWALVDPENPDSTRRFGVYGTGHPIPDEHNSLGLAWQHVTTWLSPGGLLVWHLFEHGYGAHGVDAFIDEEVRVVPHDDVAARFSESLGGTFGGTVRPCWGWTCACGEEGIAADEWTASLVLYHHRQAAHGTVRPT